MDEIKLIDAKVGQQYEVTGIRKEDRLINRLSSMGIITGSRIEVCQNFKKQPILLYARDTLVAIGRSEAEKVMIGGIDNE